MGVSGHTNQGARACGNLGFAENSLLGSCSGVQGHSFIMNQRCSQQVLGNPVYSEAMGAVPRLVVCEDRETWVVGTNKGTKEGDTG